MAQDIIGLENEKLGEPLLKQYLKKGQSIIPQENIRKTRIRLQAWLKKIPQEIKTTYVKKAYPVKISFKLNKILNEVRNKHL